MKTEPFRLEFRVGLLTFCSHQQSPTHWLDAASQMETKPLWAQDWPLQAKRQMEIRPRACKHVIAIFLQDWKRAHKKIWSQTLLKSLIDSDVIRPAQPCRQHADNSQNGLMQNHWIKKYYCARFRAFAFALAAATLCSHRLGKLFGAAFATFAITLRDKSTASPHGTPCAQAVAAERSVIRSWADLRYFVVCFLASLPRPSLKTHEQTNKE